MSDDIMSMKSKYMIAADWATDEAYSVLTNTTEAIYNQARHLAKFSRLQDLRELAVSVAHVKGRYVRVRQLAEWLRDLS